MLTNSSIQAAATAAARLGLLAGLALALAGCSEHWDRRDTLTRASGNAAEVNIATQSTHPWPPGAGRRRYDTSGKKAQLAIDAYNSGVLGTSQASGESSTKPSSASDDTEHSGNETP